MYRGELEMYLNHLKSERLLHYIFFLRDVLQALSYLALEFQKDACTLPDAIEAEESTYLQLIALQQRPGEHLQYFLDNKNEDNLFKGVQLTAANMTEEQLKQKRNPLTDAVIDHTTKRIGDLDSSHLLKDMQIFFIINLPETEEELAVYGEEELENLLTYYREVLVSL